MDLSQASQFDRPLRDKCGVFGVFGDDRAALLAYYGLYALQHRGEESAGIVTSDGQRLSAYRKMGHVGDLDMQRVLALKGHAAVGHVRYSTTGSSVFENAQPLTAKYLGGQIAVAHNGNLVNTVELKRELEEHGSIFQTSSDSEIIIHLLAHPDHREKPDRLESCLARLRGAFSFVFLAPDALYAARDPYGYRPLALGRIGDAAWVVASETSAFDLIGASYIRDVEPGELVRIAASGLTSTRFAAPSATTAQCIFEHVYFARPDSLVFGSLVYDSRLNAGRTLAQEHPVEADIVIPVPDSGIYAAQGYADESGIPFSMAMIRNHYIGRTFILPEQSDRDFRVRIKLNVVRDVVKGKRVVVVDDSIIRGTTTRSRVNLLKAAGASEIHMRIACPPTRHPCYYGIDFPDPDQLIAHKCSIEEIRIAIGATSLGYLSEEGLLRSVGNGAGRWCMACFNGKYAVKPCCATVRKDSMEDSRGC